MKVIVARRPWYMRLLWRLTGRERTLKRTARMVERMLRAVKADREVRE
jgi:hypothetical protein